MQQRSIRQRFLGFFRSHHFAIPLLGLLLGFGCYWYKWVRVVFGLVYLFGIGFCGLLWSRSFRKNPNKLELVGVLGGLQLSLSNAKFFWRWAVVFGIHVLLGCWLYSPRLPSDQWPQGLSFGREGIWVDAVDSVKKTARINGEFWVRINRREGSSAKWIGPERVVFVEESRLHGFQRSGIPEDVDWPTVFGSMGYVGSLQWPNGEETLGLTHPSYTVWGRCISWKLACLERIRQVFEKGLSPPSASMAMALLTGNTEGVEEQTVQAFGLGGLMHVLAVSGMHVALVMGSLMALCTGFGSRRKPNFVALLGLLGLGWFYVLLTGGSAAVVRAMLSATWTWLGRYGLDRRVSPMHVWSGCAYFQLLMGPYQIYNVGFLLSNAAVLSIVMLYPLVRIWLLGFVPKKNIQARWNSSNLPEFSHGGIKNWVVVVWQMFRDIRIYLCTLLVESTAMNVSVTAFTFPLIMQVFGAFPVWFLPVNLVLVPMYSLLLYGSMLVLILSGIPGMNTGVSNGVDGLFGWVNRAVLQVLELPMPQWFSVDWNTASVMLVFMGLGFFQVWIWLRLRFYRGSVWHKEIRWLWVAVGLWLAAGMEMEWAHRNRMEQPCYFQGEIRGRRFWGVKQQKELIVTLFPVNRVKEGDDRVKNRNWVQRGRGFYRYGELLKRRRIEFRTGWELELKRRMGKFCRKWGVKRVRIRWV